MIGSTYVYMAPDGVGTFRTFFTNWDYGTIYVNDRTIGSLHTFSNRIFPLSSDILPPKRDSFLVTFKGH